MESSRACPRCGAELVSRVSKRGRTYWVDARTRQYHAPECPGRKSESEKLTQEYTGVQLKAETEAKVKAETHHSADTLAEVIALHVKDLLPASKATLDEERVIALVKAHATAVRIEVSVRGSDAITDCGRQHKLFPLLLHFMGRRRNLWLVGPAGSGKTRATYEASKALGLQYGAISVGPQTTQSALFGYMDATGRYVESEFYRRYKHGGVFVFDEIDRGNPGVLTALNQAIENGHCAFPEGMVEKHPDFIAVAAGNTFGNGASREYVGALQLDAATLDRFAFLDWDYDEELETALAEAHFAAAGGTDTALLNRWLAKVRTARSKASALKIRHVVSPRASIVGADLLGSGMAWDVVEKSILWKGLDADSVGRLS